MSVVMLLKKSSKYLNNFILSHTKYQWAVLGVFSYTAYYLPGVTTE